MVHNDKVHNDTVADAQNNPTAPQPYVELVLKDDEYARICEILGRRPTDAELAMYSCLLYTSPSPRDLSTSRMPSSA